MAVSDDRKYSKEYVNNLLEGVIVLFHALYKRKGRA